ncbi:MAG TPA: hypothetical protein VFL71_03740 [Actinomycetes bacterium]|nr:hypothetical protein [Actinomycetes bacterium]
MTVQARGRPRLAWLLFLATLACLATGLVVALVVVRPLTLGVLGVGALAALLYLGFAVIGLVLSLRRPANPIGWLYAASGLVWSLNVPGEAWVDHLVRSGRPLPLAAQVNVAVGEPLWAPAIALGVTLPLLLLPGGRLRSRRWRVAVAASVAGAVLSMAGSVDPGQLTATPIANPLGLAGTGGAVAQALAQLGSVLHVGSLAAALVCLVLRFRSSRGLERQQLRWVAAGAVVAVVGLLAVIALLVLEDAYGFAPGAWLVALALALPGVPLSVAVVAATLAAVAAFAPLRRRVQDLVDRRFNRRRYDAARTVEAFAARLREQVDLDALTAELLAVVDQTVQPTQASLWLRPQVSPRPQR